MDHLYWNFGTCAGGAVFEIRLRGSTARVCLMDGDEYQAYLDGDEYEHFGGFYDVTPVAEVGLRVNELRSLDLADVKWDLGWFDKLHVRNGNGARGSGPRERMVPLINNAGATLRWFIEDVWGHFDDDHARPGAPLLPSERRRADGSCARVGDDAVRASLAAAARIHLSERPEALTPHMLRHYCASQLYAGGMDLIAIQEVLGHAWIATTLHYVHVHRTHVEDAWVAEQQRAAERLKGLVTP